MPTAPRAGAQLEARRECKKGPISAAQYPGHGLPPPGPMLHTVLRTSPPCTRRALQDLLVDKMGRLREVGEWARAGGAGGWKARMSMVERRAKGKVR